MAKVGLCVLVVSDARSDGCVLRTGRRCESGQQAAAATGVPPQASLVTSQASNPALVFVVPGCFLQAEECVEFSFTCRCEAWTQSQQLVGGCP